MKCNLAEAPTSEARKSDSEADLAKAVMKYLEEHPQAMDTLEGIAEWWVMRQKVRTDLEALTKVLDDLADQGLLERIGSGESARYRLKAKQADPRRASNTP
jgi:hypothetical protein